MRRGRLAVAVLYPVLVGGACALLRPALRVDGVDDLGVALWKAMDERR